MSAKITIKNTYILIEPHAIEYWEVIEALGILFKMPEYLEMNTIWDFPDDRIKATYGQLYNLRDIIAQHFPKSSKPNNKTAIVVKTGLQDSMADTYTKLIEDLPLEARVFSDLQSAEDWIVQS